jgi:Rho-binding antiterminator
MAEKYTPIDCNYYDLLLDVIKRKQEILLVYNNLENVPIAVTAKFFDIYTKEGEEFLQLTDGMVIRLDKIISLNGLPVPNRKAS